jgi:hypothetical protein
MGAWFTLAVTMKMDMGLYQERSRQSVERIGMLIIWSTVRLLKA